MTLEEAINRLDIAKDGWPLVEMDKYYKAVELGLEALKLNQTMRETYAHPELLVLPSETEK